MVYSKAEESGGTAQTKMSVYMNGKLMDESKLCNLKFAYSTSKLFWLDSWELATTNATDAYQPLPSNGVFLLGHDQDYPGGGFSVDQAFSGSMSMVNRRTILQ